jgi:hypothetical protein
MSRKYRIRHETSYRYAATWCIRITCCTWCRGRRLPGVPEHEISIDRAATGSDELDAFGNPLLRIELAQPHRELSVVSQMQIEVHARPR